MRRLKITYKIPHIDRTIPEGTLVNVLGANKREREKVIFIVGKIPANQLTERLVETDQVYCIDEDLISEE